MAKFLAKFLLASIKTLTISKSCSESLIKYLFRIFLIGLIGRFFKCTVHVIGGFRSSFNPFMTNTKKFSYFWNF